MDNQFARGMSSAQIRIATIMKERVVAGTSAAREKVADFGRKAADTIDAQREPTANKIEGTAIAIRRRGQNMADMAQTTANRLQTAADYIRDHDVKVMIDDAGNLIRRYPGQSLFAAAAVGFLVGSVAWRRRWRS